MTHELLEGIAYLRCRRSKQIDRSEFDRLSIEDDLYRALINGRVIFRLSTSERCADLRKVIEWIDAETEGLYYVDNTDLMETTIYFELASTADHVAKVLPGLINGY